MPLIDTLRKLNAGIAARQKHEEEMPLRVTQWRDDLSSLYDQIEEALTSIPPDMLTLHREDRQDKQEDLGEFLTIDLLFIVKGDVVLRFEPKANKGDDHQGIVEIVRPKRSGAGRLLRTTSGWTIKGAVNRTALASVNPYMLDDRTVETVLDVILRT